jgi:hypothetical protein
MFQGKPDRGVANAQCILHEHGADIELIMGRLHRTLDGRKAMRHRRECWKDTFADGEAPTCLQC